MARSNKRSILSRLMPTGGGAKPLLKMAGWVLLISAAAAAAGFGMHSLEQWVLHKRAVSLPKSVKLVLADKPWWMPASLEDQLCRQLLPANADFGDPALGQKVNDLAAASPWISSIGSVVKRWQGQTGFVELRAVYRQALARVVSQDGSSGFVDTDGVLLAEQQVPRFGLTFAEGQGQKKVLYAAAEDAPHVPWQIHYMEIYGVAAAAPAPGQKWQGQDLADGLKLAQMVLARPYWNEIAVIDVRNHPTHRISRSEPPFQLIARAVMDQQVVETRLLVDRFWQDSSDYTVPPAQALRNLDVIYQRFGRLAGVRTYLDLRFENVHASLD